MVSYDVDRVMSSGRGLGLCNDNDSIFVFESGVAMDPGDRPGDRGGGRSARGLTSLLPSPSPAPPPGTASAAGRRRVCAARGIIASSGSGASRNRFPMYSSGFSTVAAHNTRRERRGHCEREPEPRKMLLLARGTTHHDGSHTWRSRAPHARQHRDSIGSSSVTHPRNAALISRGHSC